MSLNFKIGRKLKWFLIGIATLVVGMLLFYAGGADAPTPLAVLGVFMMFIGGLMAAGMVLALIIKDMEDDEYGR